MSTLDDMKEQFSPQEIEDYTRQMKAIDSLVTMFSLFQKAPYGSPAEAIYRHQLDTAVGLLKDKPEHAIGLIEGLVAIVASMRAGGSYEQWFTEIDMEPKL